MLTEVGKPEQTTVEADLYRIMSAKFLPAVGSDGSVRAGRPIGQSPFRRSLMEHLSKAVALGRDDLDYLLTYCR